MQNENTTSNQLATNDQEQAVQNSISIPVETQTVNTQEAIAQSIQTEVVQTVAAAQEVSIPKEGKKAARRTKNIVLPFLHDLLTNKTTVQKVIKGLGISETEVQIHVHEYFGPILEEMAAVSSMLKSLDKEFKMMEVMPDRADVFLGMVKEQLSECQKRLNLMAGKG